MRFKKVKAKECTLAFYVMLARKQLTQALAGEDNWDRVSNMVSATVLLDEGLERFASKWR